MRKQSNTTFIVEFPVGVSVEKRDSWLTSKHKFSEWAYRLKITEAPSECLYLGAWCCISLVSHGIAFDLTPCDANWDKLLQAIPAASFKTSTFVVLFKAYVRFIHVMASIGIEMFKCKEERAEERKSRPPTHNLQYSVLQKCPTTEYFRSLKFGELHVKAFPHWSTFVFLYPLSHSWSVYQAVREVKNDSSLSFCCVNATPPVTVWQNPHPVSATRTTLFILPVWHTTAAPPLNLSLPHAKPSKDGKTANINLSLQLSPKARAHL